MPAVGVPSLDDLHDAIGLALAANVEVGRLRWMLRLEAFVALRKLKDSSGKYLIEPDVTQPGGYRLLGQPVAVTNRIPHMVGAGDDETVIVLWDPAQVAVARDLAPSVKLLDQTYVALRPAGDPRGRALRRRAAQPRGRDRAPGRHRGGVAVVPLDVREATARAVREAFGWPFLDADLKRSADVVWGLIEGYTRGRGNPVVEGVAPPYDLVQVAIVATARLAVDPAQRKTISDTDADGRSRRTEGGFHGWTLAERAVLDRYRRRAL